MGRLFRGVAGLLLVFGSGVATGIVAQGGMGTDSPQRVEQKRMDLAGAPGMEVIASIAEYRKGEVIDPHIHHGIEAAYVVQGTTVKAGDKEMALATGATMMFPREVRHGGFVVSGDTPLKLFTVHVVDKGKPLYDYR